MVGLKLVPSWSSVLLMIIYNARWRKTIQLDSGGLIAPTSCARKRNELVAARCRTSSGHPRIGWRVVRDVTGIVAHLGVYGMTCHFILK
eukprot:6175954-Pleurochrysis_carterae.AAC.1